SLYFLLFLRLCLCLLLGFFSSLPFITSLKSFTSFLAVSLLSHTPSISVLPSHSRSTSRHTSRPPAPPPPSLSRSPSRSLCTGPGEGVCVCVCECACVCVCV